MRRNDFVDTSNGEFSPYADNDDLGLFWVPMPMSLFDDPELDHVDRRLYALVRRFAREGGRTVAAATNARLARDLDQVALRAKRPARRMKPTSRDEAAKLERRRAERAADKVRERIRKIADLGHWDIVSAGPNGRSLLLPPIEPPFAAVVDHVVLHPLLGHAAFGAYSVLKAEAKGVPWTSYAATTRAARTLGVSLEALRTLTRELLDLGMCSREGDGRVWRVGFYSPDAWADRAELCRSIEEEERAPREHLQSTSRGALAQAGGGGRPPHQLGLQAEGPPPGGRRTPPTSLGPLHPEQDLPEEDHQNGADAPVHVQPRTTKTHRPTTGRSIGESLVPQLPPVARPTAEELKVREAYDALSHRDKVLVWSKARAQRGRPDRVGWPEHHLVYVEVEALTLERRKATAT